MWIEEEPPRRYTQKGKSKGKSKGKGKMATKGKGKGKGAMVELVTVRARYPQVPDNLVAGTTSLVLQLWPT